MAEREVSVESEVGKLLDLSVIRYSRVMEDHRVLSRALQIIQDQDVVMCITSSGDNVLNLLLDRPKKMLAIDLSSAQSALLEIKVAAIRCLQYSQYLCLLGEGEEDETHTRIKLYQQIRSSLPSYAQDYWDNHQDVLKAGVSEQGRLEKYIQKMHGVLYPSVDIEQVDKFMAAKNLTDQNALFQQLPLDKVKEVYMHFFKKSNQVEGRSEAQLKYVSESEDKVCLGLWERFYAVCTKLPVHDNFYLSWWLRGRRGFDPDSNPAMAPPFLTEEGFTKLKGLVDRVEVLTCSIEEYMSTADTRVNKIGLSDVFEYMSEEASNATFALLAKSVAPGGRMAFWNLYNHRLPSESLLRSCGMSYLDQLSKQLHQVDRVFYYQSFHVVQINNN